jgi:DNA-binding NtrC family response regulator
VATQETDTKPTVLVVDDESAIRFLCRVNLELEGYDVLEAASLTEARGHLAARPVDVVLLDMHVGIERGEGLLDELRGREPPIPVALVTGSTDVETAGGGRAQAVIGKPFTIAELTRTVRRLTATT